MLVRPATSEITPTSAVGACPPGYHPVTQEPDVVAPPGCIADKHPEPLTEMAAGASQMLAKQAAPRTTVPQGAFAHAIKQRNRIAHAGQSSQARNAWHPYGKGPLRGDVAAYSSVAGYGLENLAGRITQFWYTPRNDKHLADTLLVSVAYGGVYESRNHGKTWFSISKKLPTTVVGAVGYTPARGGTIVAITGDGSFGRYSREGAGAYWTSNNGKKWHHSRGLPSDAFAFKVAVDGAHPRIVYAAIGAGLWRSTNAGRRFRNVKLPTGRCKGKPMHARGCLLANQVTDVVVRQPGGSTDEKGGAVLAAVGWRGGNRENPNGKPQSPRNGLYLSRKGKPGTFKKLAATGFAEQDRIGRVEMGNAYGPDQDHNYVYAIVQDAVLLRGGAPGIDVDNPASANVPTVLNGIYVSPDFGTTWTKMADASQLQSPTTGSALSGVAQSSGYGPGVQSWYNEWIHPDPTKQVGGVPTRLLFGLEEVWMNEQTDAPQTGPSSFKVIGRYYSGSSCVFVQTGLPVCPTDRDDPADETTTTHPDQHDATFIPDPEGGATLVVGNDGGVNTQEVPAGQDYTNAGWGDGANNGFRTLYPYDATIAKDGVAYAGLQDNGSMKVDDLKTKNGVRRDQQIEVYGGDGFFVGVDPHDSDIAYEEYTYGAMNATKDGGKTWTAMGPPGLDGETAQFSNPFALDPTDANHLMTAGNQVDETGSGPGTSTSDWAVVYDLGTAKHPGETTAAPSDNDPGNSMTAIDLYKANAYVGYCGVCSVLDNPNPFKSGVATNVGGSKKPKRYSKRGWHIAPARGLPERYIDSVAMVHNKPKHVYVGVGGYSQRWTHPGDLDRNRHAGKGHLFFSRDAGRHFRDVSGNLPNTPVNWVTLRGNAVIVATDVGVFMTKPGTSCRRGCHFELVGKGLPHAPVFTVRVPTCDKNMLVAAVYGGGIYTYRFGPKPPCPEPKTPPPPPFQGQKVAGPFDFETDDEGWTATSTSQNGWRRQPPGNNSTQSFQVVPYTDDSTFALVSPKLTLPDRSSVKVSWAERRDTEECCDYMSLEWSSDGYVWHSEYAVAGQNPDYPTFTPVHAQFVAPKGPLYLRFRLTADALVSAPAYNGVAIDQILIER